MNSIHSYIIRSWNNRFAFVQRAERWTHWQKIIWDSLGVATEWRLKHRLVLSAYPVTEITSIKYSLSLWFLSRVSIPRLHYVERDTVMAIPSVCHALLLFENWKLNRSSISQRYTGLCFFHAKALGKIPVVDLSLRPHLYLVPSLGRLVKLAIFDLLIFYKPF